MLLPALLRRLMLLIIRVKKILLWKRKLIVRLTPKIQLFTAMWFLHISFVQILGVLMTYGLLT